MSIELSSTAVSHMVSRIWEAVIPYIGAALSIASLTISLHDRRPRLVVRSRKGEWLRSRQGQMIAGIVEIYNSSSRPNTISSYHFHAKDHDGKWVELTSEREQTVGDDPPEIYNETPRIVGAYSGVAVPIAAFSAQRLSRGVEIRVLVEDLFGKKYCATISVDSKLDLRTKPTPDS